MSVLFVISDKNGTGKTSLCAGLVNLLTINGKRAGVFKPFVSDPSDRDNIHYKQLLNQGVDLKPELVPSNGLTQAILNNVTQTVDSLAKEYDVTIVEGTCGLTQNDTVDLANTLNADVLVITGYRRELSAVEISSFRNDFGDRLKGVIINGITQYLGTEAETNLIPTFTSESMTLLGMIPENRTLLGVTALQIADHLGGRIITERPDTDTLIERFQVGGLSLDPGEIRFGLDPWNAVVVRGDRPDVQMSALKVPVSCLILTSGLEPIEYVRYEAEEEGVPIILVPGDTKSTMNNLNDIQKLAAFNHVRKMETVTSLIKRYVDIAAIYATG